MSTSPPVADYAFLSNREQSCLVAPDGSVERLCLPRPDSPSVFGALLDRTAGEFRFGPTSAQVPHQRRYVPGTMVLETTWHTPTGWLVVLGVFCKPRRQTCGRAGRRVDERISLSTCLCQRACLTRKEPSLLPSRDGLKPVAAPRSADLA